MTHRSVRFAVAGMVIGLWIMAAWWAAPSRVAAQAPTPAGRSGGTAGAFGGASGVSVQSVPPARGPGAFDLTQPITGLATLPGYRARLEVAFQGTEDGRALDAVEVFTLTVSAQPAARLLVTQDAAHPPTLSLLGDIGGVRYVKFGDGRCRGTLVSDTLDAPILPLAASLPPLLGAEEAGRETVQGVSARHYRFDPRAIQADGVTTASGDVWIAEPGGFVVKYTHRLKGTEDYFGAGRAGAEQVTYTLGDFAAAPAVDVPPGCPPGPTGAPLPPDAAAVVQRPGYTRFTTALPLQDLAAFYAKSLAGWKPIGAPYVSDKSALLMFAREDRRLTISASPGARTSVRVYLSVEAKPGK